MPKSAHILIIDIEATCSKREEVPRDEMEIIEIGAVVVDETGVVLAEFQSFARPVRLPSKKKPPPIQWNRRGKFHQRGVLAIV